MHIPAYNMMYLKGGNFPPFLFINNVLVINNVLAYNHCVW